MLTFDEIKQLYQDDDLPPPLRDKLRTLLTTPFVRNNASDAGMMPLKPTDPQTGKMLRVVQWNIERGLEFDAVRFAFSDPKKFNALMEDKGSKADEDERAKIREQIAILQTGRPPGSERSGLGRQPNLVSKRGGRTGERVEHELRLWCRVCRGGSDHDGAGSSR